MASYPDPVPFKDTDEYPNTEAQENAYKVFKQFADIDPSSIGAGHDEYKGKWYLSFDSQAQGLFREWNAAHQKRLRSGELPLAMESHLGKYPALVASLAMLLHLADGHVGPIEKSATIRALGWAEYLESHARRIYSPVTAPEVDGANIILRKIKSGVLQNEFTQREVERKKWSGLTEMQTVAGAMLLLLDHGYLIARQIETKGRPKTIFRANSRIQLQVKA